MVIEPWNPKDYVVMSYINNIKDKILRVISIGELDRTALDGGTINSVQEVKIGLGNKS